MKKLVCILLTLVMVMSLCVVALAAEPVQGNKTVDLYKGGNAEEFNVMAKVSGVDKLDIVYSIKIDWTVEDNLEFEADCPFVWDPIALNYIANAYRDTKIADTHDKANVDITITNMSNADVYYNVMYTDADGLEGKASSSFTRNDNYDELTDSLTRADAAYSSYVDDNYGFNPVLLDFSVECESTSKEVVGYVTMSEGTVDPTTEFAVGKFTVTISDRSFST